MVAWSHGQELPSPKHPALPSYLSQSKLPFHTFPMFDLLKRGSSEFVRTANYAIVYARLIVDGRDLGIHNFMVQIRDLQTHQPMPGVEVGDIGPKIGYNNQELRHSSMPHTISDFLRFRFPCPMGTWLCPGQWLLQIQSCSDSTDTHGHASCHPAFRWTLRSKCRSANSTFPSNQ